VLKDRKRELREQISQVNRELLELLNRRLELVEAIGRLKRQRGAPVLDLEREDALVEALSHENAGPLSTPALESIFREIISASRAHQGVKPIACLGPWGGPCHRSTVRRFGRSAIIEVIESKAQLLKDVALGRFECAVLPTHELVERELKDLLVYRSASLEQVVVITQVYGEEASQSS